MAAVEGAGRMTAVDAASDPKLNRLVAAQLQKTKMCAMFQRGTCRDPKCRFAHSSEELRSAPDLTKTAICRMFTRGQCKNRDCKFAHGEQELRVTPSVYKTQLCNFHMRGHCKKGMRCRHAHGDEELRSFLSQASTASPPRTPSPSDGETQSTTTGDRYIDDGALACEAPDLSLSAQELRSVLSTPPGRYSPPGALQEWYAALLNAGGANSTRITTPPPSSLPYLPLDAPTPGKALPPFPQRTSTPEVSEPMKVPLHSPSFSAPAPSPLGSSALLRPSSPLTPSLLSAAEIEALSRGATPHDDISFLTNAHLAWATQANLDFELAAAQLKVQELAAKRQMYTAAQLAAVAQANSLALPGQESHFESIMQTLQKLPSRPASPNDMVQPSQMQSRALVPPGLVTKRQANGANVEGSPLASSPREGSRLAHQPWHPTDISQKHGTAWVI